MQGADAAAGDARLVAGAPGAGEGGQDVPQVGDVHEWTAAHDGCAGVGGGVQQGGAVGVDDGHVGVA